MWNFEVLAILLLGAQLFLLSWADLGEPMDFEHYAELHVFMRMLCVQNNIAENFLTRKVVQHVLWLKFALWGIDSNREVS